MNNDPFAELRGLRFLQSRIPALDALSTFVPENQEPAPAVKEVLDRIGSSRWFPEPGGHRVLAPYEGGAYNATYFEVRERGWDHEHCKICGETVPSMMLCWVTESGPFVVLCVACKEKMDHDLRP
jgi:hypothetical protein